MKRFIKLFVFTGVVLLCSCKNNVNYSTDSSNNTPTTVDVNPSNDTVEFAFNGQVDGIDVSCINGESLFSTDILVGTKDVTFSIQPAKGFLMPHSEDLYEVNNRPFDYKDGVIHIAEMNHDYSFVCDAITRLDTYEVDFVGSHCAAYYRSNLENSFIDYHRYTPKTPDLSYIVIPNTNYEFKDIEENVLITADNVPLVPGVDYTLDEISEQPGKFLLSTKVKGKTLIHLTATEIEKPVTTALVSFVGDKCTGTIAGEIDKQRIFQYNAVISDTTGTDLVITVEPLPNYQINIDTISFTVDGDVSTEYDYKNNVFRYHMTKDDHDILIRIEATRIEEEYFTVSFDSAGGTDVPSQYVYKNQYAHKPADPIMLERKLDYWYLDDHSTPFDFEKTPIIADITLHAKWGLPKICRISVHATDFYTPKYLEYIDVNYGQSLELEVWHKKLSEEEELSADFLPYLDVKVYTSSGEVYTDYKYDPLDNGFRFIFKMKEITRDFDIYFNIKSLNEFTWAQIEKQSKQSVFQKVFPVGTKKTIISDNIPQVLRILDYSHDVSNVDNEKLTTFEFVNVYCNQKDSEKAMFSTKFDADLRGEQLDRRLNTESNSVYSRFPKDLQSVIKSTRKKIFYYDDNRLQGIKEYSSKLFVLSTNEMNALQDVLGDVYAYYRVHNKAEDRIKRNIVKNVISDYWTRTPYQPGLVTTDHPDVITISSQQRDRCRGAGYPYFYAGCNYSYCFAPAFNI